ncbi:WYL domain-containing protein [Limnohabitans sp. TS-CS-82]|uniref:WYL domain-containing protein n=1 Tax=Limnohabitans sp. TS-CS-82 TaxID=2094193 RepID=UPI000CF2C118|nr:WYL domain-containing protein [Limnohabitans sp. TS-CS-82]PQA81937.1 WYL domain-containing protein [Limnohabitans sp. TS-CS-82]
MQIHELSQAQRERLAYLELRVFFTGELRRADIENRFGVKPAAASRDISVYRELAPQNLSYDLSLRCYVATPVFVPVFDMRSDRVLTWLAQGFGDGLDLGLPTQTPFEGPQHFFSPNLPTLAALTRAICAKKAVAIDYLSVSSGAKHREVVPVALADNGLRWHLRAYDRFKKQFADFVLTRIRNVTQLDGIAQPDESIAADQQWMQTVSLQLVPHPDMQWPQAVELDYGMTQGVLEVTTRAAMAGYVLQRWSVDASPKHSLDPNAHHLWLQNHEVLRGVQSAVLAPGARSQERAA